MNFRKPIQIISFLFLISTFLFTGCGSKFPLKQDISENHYQLLNQDSAQVTFPDISKNKIMVIGFIYTHCPDICPMTTHNMQTVQEKLKEDKINNVEFISLSFDPERDRPSILKKYADIRGIKLDNWSFLTGNQKSIKKILKEFNVNVFPGDSTISDNGTVNYYLVHTDRISLVDQYGRLRKNYPGSQVNIDELIKDINNLE
jgi:protein SCO1